MWTLTSRTDLVKLNWIFLVLYSKHCFIILHSLLVFFSWQINQADFELVKAMQEKEKLSAKIADSPEKLQVGCLLFVLNCYRHKVHQELNVLECLS